nr:TrbG/VirB9 family P-type conjugative transfer protein [Sphingomonas sp.]
MIRKVSMAAFAVLMFTGTAQAADTRIRTQTYASDQIVRIVGKPGIQSTIEFGSDERIENVAVGDSSKWQITPNRRASLLFVKPLSARSRTNMTVVTDRRTYMFDLVAGDGRTTPMYALKFSYPNEKPAVAATPALQAAVPTPQQQATMTAEKLHFDWNTKGSGKLLPARVFDDGQSVYLAWGKDAPLPAILTQSEDRKEGPVNYRMSGEYIVISPVPANLVLRYGNRTALLWPSRRIAPPQPRTNTVAQRLATVPAPQNQPAVTQAPAVQRPVSEAASAAPAPANAANSSVTFANVTALYTDKLTDAGNEH